MTRDPVDFKYRFRAEPVPGSLIGDRRIGEAVRHYNFSFSERRQYGLLDILSARREHQEQFRYRPQFVIRGIEQDAADLLADGCAAGLRRLEHRIAIAPKMRSQEPGLGAFAAPVRSLKRDEEP